MTKKIYVGNLSYDTTEEQIKELISKSGSVESVNLITDKYSGKSKGFAFVEMINDEDAKKAIAEANGTELDGRNIKVNEARPPRRRNYSYRDRSGKSNRQGKSGGYRQNRRGRFSNKDRY